MNKLFGLKLGAIKRGIVLAGLVLPLGAPAFSKDIEFKDIEFRVLELPYSQNKKGTHVWRSGAAWLSAWSEERIRFCGHSVPPPAPPTVDFGKYEVVGIFLGSGSGAAPIPEIRRIYDAGAEVVVEYVGDDQERSPSKAVRAVRGAVVCRKAVAQIPRTGKPVRFQAVPGKEKTKQ